MGVVDQKKAQEKAFTKWSKNEIAGYDDLMADFADMYAAYKPYAKHATYYSEAFRATTLARLAAAIVPLEKVLANTPEKDSIDKYVKIIKAGYKPLMKEYD